MKQHRDKQFGYSEWLTSLPLPFELLPSNGPSGSIQFVEPLRGIASHASMSKKTLVFILVAMSLLLVISVVPSTALGASARMTAIVGVVVVAPVLVLAVRQLGRTAVATAKSERVLRLNVASHIAEEWKISSDGSNILVQSAAMINCRLSRQPIRINIAFGVKAWGVVWHMPSSVFMLCGDRKPEAVNKYIRQLPPLMRTLIKDDEEVLIGKADVRLW